MNWFRPGFSGGYRDDIISNMEEHLDIVIQKKMEQQAELEGVRIRKLDPGTTVTVCTSNSSYKIIVLDNKGKINILGGKYFPDVTTAYLIGSTFGGNLIKLGLIGYKMHMEIMRENETLVTTSRAKEATITGDVWEYHLDWPHA